MASGGLQPFPGSQEEEEPGREPLQHETPGLADPPRPPRAAASPPAPCAQRAALASLSASPSVVRRCIPAILELCHQVQPRGDFAGRRAHLVKYSFCPWPEVCGLYCEASIHHQTDVHCPHRHNAARLCPWDPLYPHHLSLHPAPPRPVYLCDCAPAHAAPSPDGCFLAIPSRPRLRPHLSNAPAPSLLPPIALPGVAAPYSRHRVQEIPDDEVCEEHEAVEGEELHADPGEDCLCQEV